MRLTPNCAVNTKYDSSMNKLILFDCDGVLVDSEYLASQVFSEALAKYGYTISAEESIRRFTGVNEYDCRKILMSEMDIEIPEDYWHKEKLNLKKAYELYLTGLLEPLLSFLKTSNTPRAIASNSSRDHILHCLELTSQLDYFSPDAIFSASQVAKAKPAPDVYLFAATQMMTPPENCLVIEDSITGVQAAQAANMKVFMFLGAKHSQYDWYHQELKALDVPKFTNHQTLEEAIKAWLK